MAVDLNPDVIFSIVKNLETAAPENSTTDEIG